MEKQEGVIFTNWRVGEFNDNYETIFGQDFGFSVDPTTLVKLAIDKGNKRIFLKVMYARTGMSTTQIADFNIRYAGPHLIVSDSAEPRLINLSFGALYTVRKAFINLIRVAFRQTRTGLRAIRSTFTL